VVGLLVVVVVVGAVVGLLVVVVGLSAVGLFAVDTLVGVVDFEEEDVGVEEDVEGDNENGQGYYFFLFYFVKTN